ncbi:MAG TPA: CPBP family intramembrane glutamic endopeptidase [Longimicrobiales bacterium]|nr:CPBP family intramembrane glutamic endopeptidase [Longimicrobiales bacterium]
MIRRLGAAVVGCGAIIALAGAIPLPARIMTAFLVVALPFIFLGQARLGDIPELLPPRHAIYFSSAIGIWLLAGLSGSAGALSGFSRSDMGLVFPGAARLGLWSVAATFVALGALALGRTLRLSENALLRHVLPRTSAEKRWFAMLSLSAGVGEELAYRAFLIPAIALVTGSVWVAAAISSVAFGAIHSYQGTTGALRASALGFVLAVPFVITGSVLPSMIAHTAYDIIAGILLADWIVQERGA